MPRVTLPSYTAAAPPAPSSLDYDEARDAAGRSAILRALAACGGSRARAIEALGLPARRFYREVQRLGIDLAAIPLPAAETAAAE